MTLDDDFHDFPSKADRYLYAIVDTFGKCWMITEGDTKKVEGLPSLLRQGWKPVRETPYHGHNGTNPYILILLERA